jgi:AhpD family alkylhydroperoxidase
MAADGNYQWTGERGYPSHQVIKLEEVIAGEEAIKGGYDEGGVMKITQFKKGREHLNRIVMAYSNRDMKKFFSLDSQIWKDGALPRKTKELLGLVASLVLRCDDCVTYHLIHCHREGVTSEELAEALSIGLLIGGSIAIPSVRRAFGTWDELVGGKDKGKRIKDNPFTE